MKSIQPNTNDNPSGSGPCDNPCFDTDAQVAALATISDDGISYQQ
jgi:hypothetical protein